MASIKVLAICAIALGTTGCCFRKPAAQTVAVCPAPAPVCNPCNPCGPGAVTYGYGSSYSMPGASYMTPMQ